MVEEDGRGKKGRAARQRKAELKKTKVELLRSAVGEGEMSHRPNGA